jgi:hypothetical protein
MYDIFYVSASNGNDKDWKTIKSIYPLAQQLTNIKSYKEIQSKSFTTMFWVIWDDVELTSFNLLDYKITKWDDMYVHVFKNSEHYDGICLFPKSLTVSQREFSNRFFTDKKEIDIVASIPKGYNRFEITTYDDYLKAVNESSTEMFWAIWPDVDVDINFKFDYKVPKHNSNIVHIFKNNDHYDGICLFPKNTTVSRREFYHRFFTDKKEIDIVASKPKQYNKYHLSTFEEYQTIIDDMFWVVSPGIKILNEEIFDLYFSHHNSYDRRENHVFKNLCNNEELYLTGVILCSKFKPLTKKEFETQYAVDKKEHDLVVCKFQYPVYAINNYAEYLEIINNNQQPLFWCVWSGIEIIDTSIFDLYFKPNDPTFDYDRSVNHVFKNLCNDKESYLSGVVLFSITKIISEREFNRRYLIDKKEHDLVVSRYVYPRYTLTTYAEYLQIFENETQPMFWGIWPEIEVIDNTVFNLYFDPNDGKYDHDRKENHVFKNLCNDKETFLCGLVLFSTEKIISEREFNRRYLIDKKEYPLVVSRYRYNKYILSSYDEYVEIVNNELQPMFWGIWPEIEVIDNTVFNLYFDPNDGKYDHDRKENHTFKHMFNDSEIHNNGVILFSKDKLIGQREFNHRFLIEKKEHDVIASTHHLYDVVFISYNEANAEENYLRLLDKCPRAKRVHGIKGIHNAHINAAKMCDTDMIWVVDGDAVIEDDFNFNLVMSSYDIDCVHVWRSRNPINNLEYGNGGVKLLPRQLTLNMDTNTSDMTTSISKKFKAMNTVSNVNSFNTDEFTTWRSAFRECCKLSSRTIERQFEEETQQRLDIWCTTGHDAQFGEHAIAGAKEGRQYGLENKNNLEELRKINDFEWLKEKFDASK